MAYKKEFTAEEKSAYNEKKQSDIDEMVKRIDEGVSAVFKSDKYKEYLKFASKFTDYSARNTMLINMQKPDATLVAAFGKWKEFGRQVEKGQSGISILAPVAYKTNQILEIDKPATDEFGNKLFNADGTEKTETVEKPLTGLAFKKVYIFDVSQTSGKEIPDPVTELTGDIDSARKEAVFDALKRVTGIDIEFKDIKGGAKGYYSATKNQIVIKSGMSDTQTLKTAYHEVAHNLLHDPNKKIVTAKSPRNEKEVQAESVAFIVAERFGMDTSEYSFPYIATWSAGKQLEQLKNALQEIQMAAKKISSEIESELLKLQKRGLSIEEKIADTELNNIQKAEFLIEDCSDRGVQFSSEDTKKILDFAGDTPDIGETVKLVSDMESIQKQRDSYGYDFTYMNPIDTKDEALAAFDRGEAVFLLYPDNTEGQALERADIESFNGFFGTEKEQSRDVVHEQNSDLIPVSKEVAMEMWDKDLDVFVDGIRIENREQIENALPDSRFYLSEFQYSAQLDFDKGVTPNNTQEKKDDVKSMNPNIIGNTPYNELGSKEELQYYSNLKNRHANNVAKQLDEDGVKFSGVKKGTVTTITINKADIPLYETAVTKVKESYSKHKEQSNPQAEKPIITEKQPDKSVSFKDIPICTQSFLIAKQNNNLDSFRDSIAASKACTKFIDSNLSKEYENRNLKGFVKELEEQFGMERTMYTVAATIQLKNHDGRFTREVKDRAAGFSFTDDDMRLKFLTEKHPVMLNHLYEKLIDREKELKQSQPEIEKPKLSAIYDDKFLLSTERVELRDDYRGIPETKYYNSSVNEYFVDSIGWLDNEAYDREQKFSELNAKDFYAKVTKINATYVDTDGKTGQIDVTRQEYDLLTEKTYSTDNASAFNAAKENLDERKQVAGITEKPVEFYAVRQMNDRKFAVVTLWADGLVDVVKPYIATIAEAKKALLEIYAGKKDSVRCEFVHPQTLDEKAIDMFKSLSKSEIEPDVIYRIKLNTDKNVSADKTHFIQEYIKNENADTYAIGRIMAQGTYDECRQNLDKLNNPIFEIYQIKSGDEYRDFRFENYEQLTKNNRTVDFNNYDKVYEAPVSMLNTNSEDTGEKLESIYQKFNTDHPDDFKGHSLSVSDVVVLDKKAYFVDSFGFKPLKEFAPPVQNKELSVDKAVDTPEKVEISKPKKLKL